MEQRPTRERIIEATTVLITQRGYHGFSYAHLAPLIGIHKISIHHHFPSKVDLVKAVIDRSNTLTCRALLPDEGAYADEVLQAYLRQLQSLDSAGPFTIVAVLVAELPSLPLDVAILVKSHFAEIVRSLAMLLTLGVAKQRFRLMRSAEEEAGTLLAGVHGAMISARAHGDPVRLPPSLALFSPDYSSARPTDMRVTEKCPITQGADVEPAGFEDRAAGCLLGLAIGDALGATLEFKARDSYPPLTSIVGGGWLRLRPGEWTDDTAMALALADSLLSCGQIDERDLLTRFCAWWQTGAYSSSGYCNDIGTTTRDALGRFLATGDIHSGSTAADTAGNGSLMRLAPIAILHRDNPIARCDAAIRQSLTTHGAPACLGACAGFADILADALQGHSLDHVLRSRNEPSSLEIDAVLQGSWRPKTRDQIRSTGYVVDTLEAALWCVGTTTNFRDAVLLAANLGGDADTTAAVTGQLAGALYGGHAIPVSWRTVVGGDEIARIAHQLTLQLARRAIDPVSLETPS